MALKKQPINDDANLMHLGIANTKDFDVEKITRKFYDRFKTEHAIFANFIQGIASQDECECYTTIILTHLMFIYFIQKKGLLDTTSKQTLDGDRNYLRNRLKLIQQCNGYNTFYSFYRYFLIQLFSQQLNLPEHIPESEYLLGHVHYLNGNIFDGHHLEDYYSHIHIPDEAFERIFNFFDTYSWHPDDRLDKAANEIHPAILGYIFEKYSNQKQIGAYYTQNDTTEYISKNTIIPFLFEATQALCSNAFTADGPVWSLLRANPDNYIYQIVAKGIQLPLPPEIAIGITDISQRTAWDISAADTYALPTETWREVVERRKRYREVYEKIVQGQIISINDLITYNLDISQFARDVIAYCEGPDLVLAFYESIEQVTVLDPTCGSGAFFFAALHILQPLYAACLDRMQNFVDVYNQINKAIEFHKRKQSYQINRFQAILKQVAKYHSRNYFILKSIIINNLYGVDIMEEAVEICKLRLFLKLVAQIEKPDDIELLPTIDFNVLAGNTLVGFTTLAEVRSSVANDLSRTADEVLKHINHNYNDFAKTVEKFCKIQKADESKTENIVYREYKQAICHKMDVLRSELNAYLTMLYGINQHNFLIDKQDKDLMEGEEHSYQERYNVWKESHQPFHWFIEFYSIMVRGGFDVIIGNPPYAEYNNKQFSYQLRNFTTLPCANLYPCIVERSFQLLSARGRHGMILPLAAFATKNMSPLIQGCQNWFAWSWISFYHFRPSMLFSGSKVASIPTAIYLAKVAGYKHNFSTNLIKWQAEHREFVFSSLSYCPITVSKDLANRHYYPKFSRSIENTIMEKILQHRTLHSYLAPIPNQNTMYYRSAGGLYWKVFLNFPWPYQTTSNKQCSFQESYDRDIFVALLNSSLFWWYYTTTFDTFNLKDYMLFGFRCNYPSDDDIKHTLKNYSQQLMSDFQKHAKHLKRGSANSYTVYARKSKEIIDNIDRILALHYGFTDEELDFIITYDIKYRMGRG